MSAQSEYLSWLIEYGLNDDAVDKPETHEPGRYVRTGVSNLNNLKHKISRLLLVYFSQFCQVNLHENDSIAPLIRQTSGHVRQDTERAGEEIVKETKKRAWWPHVILLVYIYCSIKFSVFLYYQYIYDYYKLKLVKLNELNKNSSESALDNSTRDQDGLASTRSLLEKQILAYRKLLKSLGAPYINAQPFILEAPMIVLIVLTYFVYFHTRIYFRYRPMNSFFIRMMLNEQNEIQNCRRMIEKEINLFVNSSKNFVENSFRWARYLDHEENDSYQMIPSDWKQLKDSAELRQLVADHKSALKQVKQLYSAGLLHPINRSPKWVDKMSTLFSVYSLGNLVYSLIFDLSITILIPYFYLNFEFETQPMDLVFMVEMFVLTEISVISTDFYLALFVAYSTDQTRLVDETRRQLIDCIHNNDATYVQVLRLRAARTAGDTTVPVASVSRRGRACGSGAELDTLIDCCISQINCKLILALMRYKIFLVQFKPIQRTFAFAALSTLGCLTILPVVMRAHVPYTPDSAKLVASYFGLVLVVFVDFFLVPISDFHNRAMRLYRALWSLAAHTADLAEQASGGPHAGRVYYRHTVWTILKELDHPERLADQFATSAYGMLITYPNLVQIHYWYSAIMLSVFFEVEALRDIFGKLLDDPFGIFRD